MKINNSLYSLTYQILGTAPNRRFLTGLFTGIAIGDAYRRTAADFDDEILKFSFTHPRSTD